MSIISRSGRARTSVTDPRAFAVSDRDGSWRNHCDMAWQYQWQGNELINQRILVGVDELDVPNEQLRNPQLPPDPRPIDNPRTEPFAYDANPSTITNWDQPGGYYAEVGNPNTNPGSSGFTNPNSWDNTVPD